ncbi:MAG: hypothetical protein U5Q03_09210 [Bacteroidota bacterium]|nr:hypothetical protein [Bacteroidota bacterium]
MIIEPVIVQCPQCQLKSVHYKAMSGTIHESISFTDGKMDVISGMISFDPVLIKCRQCNNLYFFYEAIREGREARESTDAFGDLGFNERHPGIEDYQMAIEKYKGQDAGREIKLRTLFWWKINDLIRFESGIGRKRSLLMDILNYLYKPLRNYKPLHRHYPEYKKCLPDKNENLRALFKLLNPENNPEDIYFMVEIQRELGNYPAARNLLESIKNKSKRSFLRKQDQLIRKRNPFVQQFG